MPPRARPLWMAFAALLLVGCSDDNGLPSALTRLLADHRIVVRFSASRAGWVSFASNPELEAKIILKLEDGGQLEQLYLLTPSLGRTYLLAEDRYG